MVEEKTAFSELEKQLEGGEIMVWNFDDEGKREKEPVFCGLIKDINIWQNLGVYSGIMKK